MSPKDGGPAFPTEGRGPDGMSLRDWFAGKALEAFIVKVLPTNEEAIRLNIIWDHEAATAFRKQAAEVAYLYADAMLAERERKP